MVDERFTERIEYEHKDKRYVLEATAFYDAEGTLRYASRVWCESILINSKNMPRFDVPDEAIDWAFRYVKNL